MNKKEQEMFDKLNIELESLFNKSVKYILRQIKGEISAGEREDFVNKLNQDRPNKIKQYISKHYIHRETVLGELEKMFRLTEKDKDTFVEDKWSQFHYNQALKAIKTFINNN